MTDVATSELKRAIESQHGGTATWIESVEACERFQGKTVWQGEVQVFALTGHPSALRCYAWSSPIEGSAKRRFFAVLHQAPNLTPLDAVRAAIVQEHHQQAKKPA
jgi:hypothetical protein